MTPKTEGAGKLELFERQYKERYDEIDKGGIVPMEDFFVADRVVMSLIEEAIASERERFKAECVKALEKERIIEGSSYIFIIMGRAIDIIKELE